MPTIKQLKAILKVNKSKNCKPYSTLNKAGLIRLANELGILTQNPEKKQREVKTREVKTRVKKEKKQKEVKTKVKKIKKIKKDNFMHDVKYISKKDFYLFMRDDENDDIYGLAAINNIVTNSFIIDDLSNIVSEFLANNFRYNYIVLQNDKKRNDVALQVFKDFLSRSAGVEISKVSVSNTKGRKLKTLFPNSTIWEISRDPHNTFYYNTPFFK